MESAKITLDKNHSFNINKSFSFFDQANNFERKKKQKMILPIVKGRVISDVQQGFNKAYPFLKIEFYKDIEPRVARKYLNPLITIESAGLKYEGSLEITDIMTVGQLENVFSEKFGLRVQVSRKSGSIWLETTMTDNWTLKQQNDHGRELSEPSQRTFQNEIDLP
jgi:hypothetical protein